MDLGGLFDRLLRPVFTENPFQAPLVGSWPSPIPVRRRE